MHFMDRKKNVCPNSNVLSPWIQVFSKLAQTPLSNYTLCSQLPSILSCITLPNIITIGTCRCKLKQNITASFDLASVTSVMESHVLPPPPLSKSAPLKSKSNRPTKWFSLTPRGDKVHFEATHRGLSIKHPAIHNCGFDKMAFFSTSKVKEFSNGPSITTVETNKPHGTTKWDLCKTGEGNKCHKNVISPRM